MGCPSDHGGISLGWGSGLYDPRPRPHLWRHRHSSIACHGHSGQAYRTGFTLAEWLCRTADRVDPSRVLGSYRRFRRGPSAPNSAIIRALLQRHQDPSIMRRFLARFSGPGASNRSKSWADSITTTSGFEFSVHTAGKHVPALSQPSPNPRDIVVIGRAELAAHLGLLEGDVDPTDSSKYGEGHDKHRPGADPH